MTAIGDDRQNSLRINIALVLLHPGLLGYMAQHFWDKFWYFNYYMDKTTFYEKLPEVKVSSKVTLYE